MGTQIEFTEEYAKDGTLVIVCTLESKKLQIPIFEEELEKKSLKQLKENAKEKLARAIHHV